MAKVKRKIWYVTAKVEHVSRKKIKSVYTLHFLCLTHTKDEPTQYTLEWDMYESCRHATVGYEKILDFEARYQTTVTIEEPRGTTFHPDKSLAPQCFCLLEQNED